MLEIDFATLKNNLKIYCDKVSNDDETITVFNRNKKIVILSFEKYDKLEKTARNAEYLEMIERRMKEYSAGKFVQRELIENE